MNVIKPETKFDFVAKKNICMGMSVLIIVLGIISITIHKGLNLGIDFAGGTLVQLKFEKEIGADKVRDILEASDVGTVDVQEFGSSSELLVKIGRSSGHFSDPGVAVKEVVQEKITDNAVSVERVEMVGPKVGNDLRNKALLALIYAIIGMVIYITWRFEFRYAIAAILALVHDMLITIAALSFTNTEFTLQIVAALLTILGYSINDTIVVFDRIRENYRLRRKDSLEDLINLSINNTLSRSVITSLTVFFVVVVLAVFGGSVIHDFSFTLVVGVVVGTYSSVFIAAPILLFWQKFSRSSLAPSKKEVL